MGDEGERTDGGRWTFASPGLPLWARWLVAAAGIVLLGGVFWVLVAAVLPDGASVMTQVSVGFGLLLVLVGVVGAFISRSERPPLPEGWGPEADVEERWTSSPRDLFAGLSQTQRRAGVVAGLGLLAQVVFLLAALWPLADAPFEAGPARTYAALGLVAALVSGAVIVQLLRNGWMGWGLGAGLLALGWVLGVLGSSQIPVLMGDGFIDIDAWAIYLVFAVPAVAVTTGLLVASGAYLEAKGKDRWRAVATTPLFLWTGFHAELLLYIWRNAPALAAGADPGGNWGLFITAPWGFWALPLIPV